MSQTALITGASSGIGLELAKLFAKSKHDLILVARSGDKLESLRQDLVNQFSIHAEAITADLAEVDAAEKLLNELDSRNLVAHILVNNAGFGELGRFQNIAVDRQVNMARLNVVTLMHLTRLLLPEMVKRKSGGILNVASTAAFQPGPNMAVYYATKAFVLSFSEALHEELLETGVRVTCLAPGPTQTGFGQDSGMINTKLFASNAMDVRLVAKAGFDGLAKNRAIVIPGIKNQLGAMMTRIFPRSLVRKMVKRFQSLSEQ
jgi:short-subunit dehydrogenase